MSDPGRYLFEQFLTQKDDGILLDKIFICINLLNFACKHAQLSLQTNRVDITIVNKEVHYKEAYACVHVYQLSSVKLGTIPFFQP